MFRTKTGNTFISKNISSLDSSMSEPDADHVSSHYNGDGSLLQFSSTERGKDERFDREFSADLQPLTFKMTRSAVNSPPDASSSNFSLAKLRERLQRSTGLTDITGMNYWFKYLDIDSFEKYLKSPQYIKLVHRKTDIKRFRRLFLAQELNQQMGDESTPQKHVGGSSKHKDTSHAIWSVKFSQDGRFMASGSKDGTINVWKVIGSPVERWESDVPEDKNHTDGVYVRKNKQATYEAMVTEERNLYGPVFHPHPIISFKEHNNDVLAIDWSNNGFLLSSSMDKTVKLWNTERTTSLRTFMHPDFVTCVNFCPADDRFFISGCLDHKCRFWSILDKSVIYEFDCNDLITSMTVSCGSGRYTIVGTFNGYIHILNTRGLEHVGSFHITDKQTQGINHKRIIPAGDRHHHGPRVTGIQSFKDSQNNESRLLITSNDSKIRVFDLESRKMLEYLKGFHGGSSQHEAYVSGSSGQDMVLTGSDDHWVYGWILKSSQMNVKRASKPKKTGGVSRSGSIKNVIRKSLNLQREEFNAKDRNSYITNINTYEEPRKSHFSISSILPTHPFKDQPIKNKAFMTFHAHHSPVTTATIAYPETSKILSLSNDIICELTLEYFNEQNAHLNKENSTNSMRRMSLQGRPSSSRTAFATRPTNNALPDMVKAVGTILVTTDNNGVIRVFRADLPLPIRKMVLKKLQEHKAKMMSNSHSSDSVASMNRRPKKSSSFTHSTKQSTPSTPPVKTRHTDPRLLKHDTQEALNQPAIRRSNSVQVPSSTGSTPRQPRSSRIFINNLFSYSTSSLTSLKQLQSSTPQSHTSTDLDKSQQVIPNRCNVCNGSRFEQRNSNAVNQGRNYFCADCGTQQNSFR